MRRLRRLALMALFAAPAALADPYEYLDFKMLNGPNDPFPWWIDGRSQSPAGLSLSDVEAASKAAWQAWDDVGCAWPAFTYSGRAAPPTVPDPADAYSTYNVSTLWVSSTTDEGYDFLLGWEVTATALPLSYAGVLRKCNIYMNAASYTWSVVPTLSADQADVQSFVEHEVGHCLGLTHAFNDANEVMGGNPPYGVQRVVLTASDIRNVCQRYPMAGTVGSPCFADGGCAGGADGGLWCVTPPLLDGGQSAAVCTSACPLQQNYQCPLPFVCQPSALFAPAQGACLPPDHDVTQVGAPCAHDSECGSTRALCQLPGPLPSGAVAWQDGYCMQSCQPGTESCPAGSQCADLGGGNLACLQTCTFGLGDCRPGYSCVVPPSGGKNVCAPACHTDADCGSGGTAVCRVCDGTCLAKQNPVGAIGDLCHTADTCGPGQVCATYGTAGVSFCTQTCGLSCSTCPAGSSCHPIGVGGELYCLRDCSSGTCPSGMQCADLSTGSGCLPACQNDIDCPVGTHCNGGECQGPRHVGGDAGCLLCGSGDAGGWTEVPVTDAGSDLGKKGGCGCDGAPSLSGGLALLLAIGFRRVRP